MKNSIILLLVSVLFIGSSSAQTTLYTQNFDAAYALPAGWHATANSWVIDTAASNASTGYTGATGHGNLVIRDTTANMGNDSLISEDIATTGYNNITVEWASRFSKHFADSGSTIAFYYSADNGATWNNVAYTENANNSIWAIDNAGAAIALPAAAANVAMLKLMWVSNIRFTPSGTYRIDDLKVSGTQMPSGINDINVTAPFAKIFMSNNAINIAVAQTLNEPLTTEVYDLSGRMISTTGMTTQTLAISSKQFSEGMYLVRLYNSTQSMITKVLVK